MLAPWQRLGVLKTFIYRALNFAMRMGTFGKTDWAKLDASLRPLIKKTLYLPRNAANEYQHSSTTKGACGIPIAAKISDAARVDEAFKPLTSQDTIVADLARRDVFEAVSKGIRANCTPHDVEEYLSANTEGALRTSANELQNVWMEVRKASRGLVVS